MKPVLSLPNLDITPEQYFEETEKKITRFFGNRVDPKDGAEGYLDTLGTSIKPIVRVGNYHPEGYEIAKDNIVPEEMASYLSFMQVFCLPPDDYLPDMTEENVNKLTDEAKAKWNELLTDYVMPYNTFVPVNGIFGDEDRLIANSFCKNFQKAHDIAKNVILMDDTEGDARAKKEDAIAKLCTDGLRNVTKYINASSKSDGMRDNYVAILTISKMLDWIDKNKWLRDKIQLEEDEWTYCKGLKALGEIVRNGETEYDNFLKNNRDANEEAAEQYRKFSYALYLEKEETLKKNTDALNEKLDSIQHVLEKDDNFCRINRLNQHYKKEAFGKSNKSFSTCEEMITIQKFRLDISPVASDIVKRLGKCTSKEEIDAIVAEEAAKAGEIPVNSDNNSFYKKFGQHHTVKEKIIEPDEIAPLTDEQIKSNEQSRNKNIQTGVKNFFKGEIKDKAQEIYSEMDLFKNDNLFRGSSPEFRDTKELLGVLVNLSKNDEINRKDFKSVLNALKKKTEKYLNKKDAASGARRTERNNDSYANRRYNLMLRCSEMVSSMIKKEDDVEYKHVINDLCNTVNKTVALPHPEAHFHIATKGVEYVLVKNSVKTAEEFKKDLIKRYYDGTLNSAQLVAKYKDDFKSVNNYINNSVLDIRKSCAESGMSVGESEKMITNMFDTVFDTAIEIENASTVQRKKEFKNAKTDIKNKSEGNEIKRSNSF